jgi:hypothetical protein
MKSSAQIKEERAAAVAKAAEVTAAAAGLPEGTHVIALYPPATGKSPAIVVKNALAKIRVLKTKTDMEFLASATSNQSWTKEQKAQAQTVVVALEDLSDLFGPVAFDVSALDPQTFGMLKADLAGVNLPDREKQPLAWDEQSDALTGYSILPVA